MPRPPSKPTIAVIGTGRVGSLLAKALNAKNYPIQVVVSRRRTSARRLASSLGTKTIALSADRIEQLPVSDLLLICTPDDAIPKVAAQLRKNSSLSPDTVVLHTSGALTSDALEALSETGAAIGSMHPLLSITSETPVSALAEAYYCLEGDKKAVSFAKRIVEDLGGRSFAIAPTKKALYHAAAVLSAGHTVALHDLASALLVSCGLTPRRAHEVLMPLLRSTLENLSELDTSRALTGTYVRGDIETAKKHVAALNELNNELINRVFATLAQHSLQLASRRGLDSSVKGELDEILNDLKQD